MRRSMEVTEFMRPERIALNRITKVSVHRFLGGQLFFVHYEQDGEHVATVLRFLRGMEEQATTGQELFEKHGIRLERHD